MSQSEKVGIKINKVFIECWKDKSRYQILWGGSGSGKSIYAAQQTILRINGEEKHRILCIRKVANTLRASVYQILYDTISALGLMSEFKINQTEMRFTHLPTGNEILLCGLDDVEKLKSIAGITSIWVEEATEISEADFDQIDLRLRGETVNYKQIVLTFNPIDERHWLKKRFFDNPPENSHSLRTTFKDNSFIDDEYRQVLEMKASLSPNLYRIYYLGEWGREEVKRPYCHNFNQDKHVSTRAVFNPQLPVYFSMDFNVEPFICHEAHIFTDRTGIHFHIFHSTVIEKNGSVPEMCDLLENTYGLRAISNAYFTGDAMQRKREIVQRDNQDAWRQIDMRFRLGRRLQVPKANPSVKENRHLVNALFAFHPDLIIHPSCKHLIYDCQFVEATVEGDIVKDNRKNDAQRADALDGFRYMANTWYYDFYEKYKIK